jgi:hypothetical protein
MNNGFTGQIKSYNNSKLRQIQLTVKGNTIKLNVYLDPHEKIIVVKSNIRYCYQGTKE